MNHYELLKTTIGQQTRKSWRHKGVSGHVYPAKPRHDNTENLNISNAKLETESTVEPFNDWNIGLDSFGMNSTKLLSKNQLFSIYTVQVKRRKPYQTIL